MKPLIENWNKFVNENEGGDIETAMRVGEKDATKAEIPDEAIEKTGKSPEELLDDVENAKQQLLSLVTTVSEDEAYSKIKNLMLTPLEDKTTEEKRELVGMALKGLGVTTVFFLVPALFAGWWIGAGTVAIAVGYILAWLGGTLERRAEIEQGKAVPVMSAGGESEGGRARYTPEKVAQMKALQERNKTKMTKARLKEIIKEEMEALLGEEELDEEEKMNIGKMHLKKGRCKHMGSEECPEGSPQYNLAKRFKSGDIHKANLKKGKNPHGPG